MKCPNAFYIKTKPPMERIVEVPCGKCEFCRKRRSIEWSVRLYHQMIASGYKGVFVTLTYDEEHVPMRGLYETLKKEDLVKYIKRLRNSIDNKFLYFCVGEYGEKYQRPHYHCLLFGLGIEDKKYICSKWDYGMVDVGLVELKSIHYVTGYVRKKQGKNFEDYKYRHKAKPFQIQSQGLGLEYIENSRKYLDDNDCINFNGVNVGIPRYYLKKGLLSLKEVNDIRIKMEEERFKEFEESGLSWIEYRRMLYAENVQRNANIAWKNKNFRRNKL